MEKSESKYYLEDVVTPPCARNRAPATAEQKSLSVRLAFSGATVFMTGPKIRRFQGPFVPNFKSLYLTTF